MNKTVFLVDDDVAIVDVVTIILQDAGFTVSTAPDSKTLFQLLKKTTPAVIFLDIWIGDEDGREVVRMLKKKQSTKHIPIVMISANNETRKIAEQAGVDDFLAKPFDMYDLLALVEKYTKK